MIEIILVALIFIACLVLIRINFLSSLILALVLSIFLHKELFSIYLWDLLPIRIFLGAFLLNSLYEFYKFNKFSTKFLKYLLDPLVLALLFFFLTKLISTFNTLDLKTSLGLNVFYLTIFNFVLTIYFKLKDSEIINLYKTYIFIAFLTALVPFIQIYLYFNHNYLFGAILNVAGLNVNFPDFAFTPSFFTEALKLVVMTRLGSIFWDVNHYGGFLAGLLIPALAFCLISKEKKYYKNWIYFFIISTGLFLTNSRSAWVLAFVSFLVFSVMIIYRKIGKKGVYYSLFGLLAVFLFLFSLYQDKDSFFREKVRSDFHYRMDSFDSHFLLLQGAVEVFDNYPIIGGGTGSFFEHFKKTTISNEFLKRDPAGLSGRVPAHSIWGEVMAENGALGIFAFVGLIFLILGIFGYSIIHSKDWESYFLYSSFIATLFGWLVAGIFYSYNSEFFFILLLFPVIYTLKKEKIIFEELFHFYKEKNIYLRLVIGLICLGLLFFGLGDNKLITFDESIYAKVSKNIFESGDYLTLRWGLNSNSWFEKPPLYFVITAYFYQIFGVSEFSTRLATVLFSILGLFFTYRLAKLLFKSNYAAILAIFGLILNTSYLYYSRIGMLDVILTCFITGSIYYFVNFGESKKKLDLILSGIMIGLAVMTKSLIGFLPLVIIGIYYLINRFVYQKRNYLFLDLFWVGITSILVAAPWHLYMYQLHGDKFIENYFEYHQLTRFKTVIEDKGGPWYFYINVIRNTMRLWFVILLPALLLYLYSLYKKRICSESVILLISSLVILLLFSDSSSKLKWYIMPIYPFLYIICAYLVFYFFNFLIKLKFNFKFLTLIFYLFIFINLAYLFYVRDMVYTSDLNQKQVAMIQANNALPGVAVTYFDKIDYPVGLFYSIGRNDTYGTLTGLKETLTSNIGSGKYITFITGKSRFESVKRLVPEVIIIAQNDDFVLGALNYPIKN